MENNFKCWKKVESEVKDNILRIDGEIYDLTEATEEEVENGNFCINNLYIERKYKTQVAGLGKVYYDMRSENLEIRFEELIFSGGKCIGIYHDGLVFLIYNEKTYYQEKYLGEMPTGPDSGIDFYDYYYLRCK